MKNDGNALGGCYLSESLAVSLAGLLSNEHQLLALLIPLMHFIETGQQAHEQHEGDQAHQGEDGYSQGRQLIGLRGRRGLERQQQETENMKCSVAAEMLLQTDFAVQLFLSFISVSCEN